jgi:acetolactate synthase-1/2/3 large subunit
MLSADISLLLGSRFNANLLYGRSPLFAPDSAVIQVDVNPAHLGGQRRPALALTGDVTATLEAITTNWDREPDSLAAWRADVIGAARASRRQWSEEAERPAEGIHPGWLARTTADFAARQDAPFVVDGGDSVIWGLAFGVARGPGRHIFLGSAMGTLGVGLPYALAAALAADEPSILYTGDGAFGLSAMEVDTVGRTGTGVLAVVVNNGGWAGGDHDFRYHLLADAAGGQGIRVDDASALEDALEAGWATARGGRPAVVDVVTDRGVHSEFMGAMDSLAVM